MNLTQFLDQRIHLPRLPPQRNVRCPTHGPDIAYLWTERCESRDGVRVKWAAILCARGFGDANASTCCVAAVVGAANVRLATEPEIHERCVGCEPGVVSVFGSHFGLQTIVDESVSKKDDLVFQGNTHAESIGIRFADFYVLEHPRIATIIEQHEEAKAAS